MNYKYIDYRPYYDPKDVKNYELFIGPGGEYYKVKTSYESDENCTHYEWAIGYFKKNKLEFLKEIEFVKNKTKTEIDILINYFGFIRYTHCGFRNKPIFVIPNKDYFGYILSYEQKESIYHLLEFNNEKIDEDLIKILEEETFEYEEKIQKAFQKILRNS